MVGAPPAIPENYVSSSPRELANVMGGRSSPPAFSYQQNGDARSADSILSNFARYHGLLPSVLWASVRASGL